MARNVYGYVYRICVFAFYTLLLAESQAALVDKTVPDGWVRDDLFTATGGWNRWMATTDSGRNCRWVMMVTMQVVTDIAGLFVIWQYIARANNTIFGTLILTYLQRQPLQLLCTLPEPTRNLWLHTEVPALFTSYEDTNDFFFSGHTALWVSVVLFIFYLAPARHWFWRISSVICCLFVMVVLIVTRSHYTIDVYGGITAAILSFGGGRALDERHRSWRLATIHGWLAGSSARCRDNPSTCTCVELVPTDEEKTAISDIMT